jgi:hypothetical protein
MRFLGMSVPIASDLGLLSALLAWTTVHLIAHWRASEAVTRRCARSPLHAMALLVQPPVAMRPLMALTSASCVVLLATSFLVH